MKLFQKILQPFASFRGRLLGIVSLGIVSLALTAAITSALVTGQRAAEQMVAQGLKTVETLAEQSVLSLLYESSTNAEKPLEAIMSFPNLQQAGVFMPDLTPLLTTGNLQLPFPEQLELKNIKEPALIKDTNQNWHFVAPVQVASQDLFLDDDPRELADATELLGYCYVVIDKITLRELQFSMIMNNIFIALSFAIILSLLVNYGIDRMMQPLYKLIGVMENNEQGQTRNPADLNGPKEIIHIASVFNRMMESLDERDRRLQSHGIQLESMVQIRTRELVAARDAALSASRHKSAFLANMSHELRTPLQAIIGYADITREELEVEGSDEQIEGLDRIINNATRLLSLINNILDIAKVESGKMDLQLEMVNLELMLKEAVDTILPIAAQNQNLIEWKNHGNSDTLWIDREKLLQMVLNLLSNAAKFTKNGSITLSSSLSEAQLIIKITDTGIGMKEEEQKIIFEEFRQVDGSTTRDVEGTGLGLAITKRFAEQMGGKIHVDSSPGKGSTFSILIPLPIEPYEHNTLSMLEEAKG